MTGKKEWKEEHEDGWVIRRRNGERKMMLSQVLNNRSSDKSERTTTVLKLSEKCDCCVPRWLLTARRLVATKSFFAC